jgi:hypothetical protein
MLHPLVVNPNPGVPGRLVPNTVDAWGDWVADEGGVSGERELTRPLKDLAVAFDVLMQGEGGNAEGWYANWSRVHQIEIHACTPEGALYEAIVWGSPFGA